MEIISLYSILHLPIGAVKPATAPLLSSTLQKSHRTWAEIAGSTTFEMRLISQIWYKSVMLITTRSFRCHIQVIVVMTKSEMAGMLKKVRLTVLAVSFRKKMIPSPSSRIQGVFRRYVPLPTVRLILRENRNSDMGNNPF